MDKIRRTIKGDLWIILLDIISVNAAYYLALLIRFFDGVKSVNENSMIIAING